MPLSFIKHILSGRTQTTERKHKKWKKKSRWIVRIGAAAGEKKLAPYLQKACSDHWAAPTEKDDFICLFQYKTNVILVVKFRSSPACVWLSQIMWVKLYYFLSLSSLQSAERSCLLQIGSQYIFEYHATVCVRCRVPIKHSGDDWPLFERPISKSHYC